MMLENAVVIERVAFAASFLYLNLSLEYVCWASSLFHPFRKIVGSCSNFHAKNWIFLMSVIYFTLLLPKKFWRFFCVWSCFWVVIGVLRHRLNLVNQPSSRSWNLFSSKNCLKRSKLKIVTFKNWFEVTSVRQTGNYVTHDTILILFHHFSNFCMHVTPFSRDRDKISRCFSATVKDWLGASLVSISQYLICCLDSIHILQRWNARVEIIFRYLIWIKYRYYSCVIIKFSSLITIVQ